MKAIDLTSVELGQALARAAGGLYAAEAEVRLLLEHGDWPVELGPVFAWPA